MNQERDSGLEALFAAAPRAASSAAFVTGVMREIDRRRRRMVLGWIAAGLIITLLAWWASAPIMSTFELASRLMPDSLIALDSELLSQLLAPVNSVTGVLGLVFLFVWYVLRKVRN